MRSDKESRCTYTYIVMRKGQEQMTGMQGEEMKNYWTPMYADIFRHGVLVDMLSGDDHLIL